ncbi:MAG: hypothetical protein IPO92_02915 [Saprospiraceae bacterium]|nr:hypothetical protein [Saprospiraceae bacterium]
MESTFRDWIGSSTKKLKAIEVSDIGTQDRWTQTAHGWVEVDLFLEDIISGNIYMQSSWKTETEKISFIFDLSAGKEVSLQDIFKDDFDSNNYFKKAVVSIKNEKLWKQDRKKWCDKQKFEHVTLSEEGFKFTSAYSTIYGEEEILIPYKDIEIYIKDKRIQKEFLKK